MGAIGYTVVMVSGASLWRRQSDGSDGRLRASVLLSLLVSALASVFSLEVRPVPAHRITTLVTTPHSRTQQLG
jgi:hypothetical protein